MAHQLAERATLETESQSKLTGLAFEHHVSVKEVAEMWGLGVDVIRRLFANEEGVIRLSHPETLHKRNYCSLRIPESVMRRVHRKLTQVKNS